MRVNIASAHNVILAEAAVFALAKTMPRTKADEVVRRACGIALSEGKSLIEVVKELTSGMIADGAIDWRRLAAPENYLGVTEHIIDRVLQEAKKVSQP
jgi:3-carboxy-cis,cis-muconate cycloisomerase